MLVLAIILFGLACLLTLVFTFINHAWQRRAALVEGEVTEEVDRIHRSSQQIDSKLANQICEGKPMAEMVDQWQVARAAVFASGRTKDPWRWTHDDLLAWKKNRGCFRFRRENSP